MNVITTAFEVAAKARSRVLGIQPQGIFAMEHPLASRTEVELAAIARAIAASVARGLTAS